MHRILYSILMFFLSGCVFLQKEAFRPESSEVSIAMAYLQQKDFERARLSLNKALVSEPHSADAWDAFAYLEELTGNLLNAEKAYRYAIQLDSRRGEAHNNYGIFLCRHGREKAGIKEILIATQLPRYIYRASAYKNARLCALSIHDKAAAQKFLQEERRNKNLSSDSL